MKRRVVRHEVVQPPDQSYRLIALTQNQNAAVDAEDFEFLNQWNWCATWDPTTKSFYAVRDHGRIRMHRQILGCRPEEEGDHRNNDTLDNRRSNLRACTRRQNGANRTMRVMTQSSKFRGVYWNKHAGKWISQIGGSGFHQYLGLFVNEEDAARAYDVAASAKFGEFAKLNFPNLVVESRP
jgi:hypothetical protein